MGAGGGEEIPEMAAVTRDGANLMDGTKAGTATLLLLQGGGGIRGEAFYQKLIKSMTPQTK